MTKEENVFMIDNNLKTMGYYCEHDEKYEAQFEGKNGEKAWFYLSKENVLKALKAKGIDITIYEKDKNLLVAEFYKMAQKWYVQTHGKK